MRIFLAISFAIGGFLMGAANWAFATNVPAGTIALERQIHFQASDGRDLVVEAGTYTVQQAGDAYLRLLPQTDKPAIEIQAGSMIHEETISSPTALLIAEEGQEDEVHLVLVLPDGLAFDATGTFSGTRSRGTRRALSATTLHTSLVQSAAFLSGVASQPSVLYGIDSTGALKWYRHNGAQTGAGLNTPGAWTGPTEVGAGWQNFTQVVPGGGNILYGITPDGTLKWYSHDDAKNGTFAWQGAKNVGTGWQGFKQVFSGSEGILYAIAPDGTLKWFRHMGYRDGAASWEGPKTVGTGWQNFKDVFGMGDGIIYTIAGDGKLKWYKHTGFRDGTFAWEDPKDVGTGWQNFKAVFAAGNGIIYAIASNGILKWYKHLGYQDGTFRWEGAKDIGAGWQGFTKVVSLLPLAPAASSPEEARQEGQGEFVGMVTWGYLRMHHPEMVLETLKQVQGGKQAANSLTGLAGEPILKRLLATDLRNVRLPQGSPSGVVSRGLFDKVGEPTSHVGSGVISDLKNPSTSPPTILPPNVLKVPSSPKDTQRAAPSAKDAWTALLAGPQNISPERRVPLPVDFFPPVLNLGHVWDKQVGKATLHIVAPSEGTVTASMPDGIPYRIIEIQTYSGKVMPSSGNSSIQATTRVTRRPDFPEMTLIAPPFRVPVKAGQDVTVTVEFAPKFNLFKEAAGEKRTILHVEGNRWSADVPVTGFFEGLPLGVIGMLDTNDVVFIEQPS